MMSKKFEVVTEWAEPMKQMDPFLEQKLRHRDAVSSVYDPRWRDKDLRLNATLPGSGIWRIWWLHSSHALCMPTRFEDWKNTLSILILLLPLPPPHELCLHPNPCWWSGLSFLWNQHWLLFCGWLHLSTHPNQCYDSVFIIVLWERRAVQLREAEGFPQELTTATPFIRVVTLYMSTGFSFAAQSRDSSSHILTMSSAYLTAPSPQGDAASFPCVHISH